MKRVLLINGSKFLIEALKEQGITFRHVLARNCEVLIDNGKEELYNNGKRLSVDRNTFAIFIDGLQNLPVRDYLERHKVRGIYNGVNSCFLMDSKVAAYFSLKDFEVKIPKTICTERRHIMGLCGESSFLERLGNPPYILKANDLRLGEGIGIFNTVEEAKKIVDSVKENERFWLVQEYISQNKRVDERHVVFNGAIINSGIRVAGEGKVTTHIKNGGRFEPFPEPLDGDTFELVLQAANSVGAVYCGVDVIRDENGTPYVLEVNSMPGDDHIIEGLGYNHLKVVAEFVKDNIQ